MTESDYQIRAALVEELTLLAHLERSAAALFHDTPYSFLVDADPLPLEFVQQQYETGHVWVAIDRQNIVLTLPALKRRGFLVEQG